MYQIYGNELMSVDEKFKRYVEQNIFPQYRRNDKRHQIEHIHYVLNRCYKLSKNRSVDNNMLYVMAAYHDIGHHVDYKNHEKVSAQYANFFLEDREYNNYLKELHNLLNNKEQFIERLKRIISKIK